MGEIIKKARKEAELAKRSAKLEGLPGINIAFTSTGLEAVGFSNRSYYHTSDTDKRLPIAWSICERQWSGPR